MTIFSNDEVNVQIKPVGTKPMSSIGMLWLFSPLAMVCASLLISRIKFVCWQGNLPNHNGKILKINNLVFASWDHWFNILEEFWLWNY